MEDKLSTLKHLFAEYKRTIYYGNFEHLLTTLSLTNSHKPPAWALVSSLLISFQPSSDGRQQTGFFSDKLRFHINET